MKTTTAPGEVSYQMESVHKKYKKYNKRTVFMRLLIGGALA